MSEDKINTLQSGRILGYKTEYEKDGSTWYTIGVSIDPKQEPKEMGICLDFKEEDIQDVMTLLKNLKKAKSDIIKRDIEHEKLVEKIEAKEKTLLYKVVDDLQDIHISILPFYWKLRRFLVSRPITSGNSDSLYYKVCNGFYLGPLCITCGDRLAKFLDLSYNKIRAKIKK